MAENEQVEVKTNPQVIETITLKQNGFSNGKVVTFIEEMKLELTDGWQTRAKKELARVHNINFDLQNKAGQKVEE